ncbi:sodium:proton antiporter [Flaviflexus equikiangi]|uniref:NADH-quinone oxidoreductase subunit K n=1 Tax=Flaviflexus equikiangi TaxID=2758573 RepID=A0ABS2TGE2_9ACTO|nr:NADH-quinone oxidoreductase subunit K [Flaviflexus equikiangi]MBM9432596.1 NADH-quinone oxidoreductase subunit K [Flaviflexus equikiangi]
MIVALTVGVLIAGATYLLLQRDRFKVIIGFMFLSHGVHLAIFTSGGTDRRDEPLVSNPNLATTADPLPQAFVLTAIVISFAVTMYMVVLAVTGDDEESDSAIETEAVPYGAIDGEVR